MVDGNSEPKGNRSIKVSEFIAGAQEDFKPLQGKLALTLVVTNPDNELVLKWAKNTNLHLFFG